MTVDVVIAVRSPRQNIDDSLSSGMAFAAPAALADLGAFVLGHHALDLKQQIVFRRGADRAVEEDHLDPGPPELVDQQHLVGVVAGQAVGAMDIKTVERSRRDRIAQALQRGSDQGSARISVIDEATLRFQADTILGEAGFQGRDLAGDRPFGGVGIRNPSVDGNA
jgi:hypothetical protein